MIHYYQFLFTFRAAEVIYSVFDRVLSLRLLTTDIASVSLHLVSLSKYVTRWDWDCDCVQWLDLRDKETIAAVMGAFSAPDNKDTALPRHWEDVSILFKCLICLSGGCTLIYSMHMHQVLEICLHTSSGLCDENDDYWSLSDILAIDLEVLNILERNVACVSHPYAFWSLALW